MNEVPLTFWQHLALVVAPYVGIALGFGVGVVIIRLWEKRHG